MASHSTAGLKRPSPVANGLALFAGLMMIITGIFQVLQGIVALANDDFFVRTPNYTFDIDLTTWGWLHLVGGVVLALVGVGVVTGNLFSRIFGMFIVALLMIDNFLFVPYAPFWSLLMIALDGWILWALATAPAHE